MSGTAKLVVLLATVALLYVVLSSDVEPVEVTVDE